MKRTICTFRRPKRTSRGTRCRSAGKGARAPSAMRSVMACPRGWGRRRNAGPPCGITGCDTSP
ncbi:hypothetical protein OCGS_1579 [Oceaniovalibus guishaninsula JLT2003]|uniref:Uncharacterized protein n=1 Tax=Oceaniovalibus guishaninsula JLT2003 TaxID=1231392 RepID=K2I5T5_9RHOB|nr:hypothetical protein OCGS_1579 [Oceaniovalibus guishaninsula JLT2003]